MAYRADIEIAVRGASQITNLQQQLISTASAVDRVSTVLGNRGVLVNSVQNLGRVAAQANTALRSAATGTTAQKQAIDIYVKSLAAAEKAELSLTAAIKQRQKELGIAQTTAARGAGGSGGRIGGAVSGAIIGGAFPLLFGQGGGAAAGGAIGGLVGGLAGPGGSFAGSLLGTLIGDIASKAGQIKQLGQELGFSAEQTELLSQAAQKAGRDFDQFQAAVQNIRGLGLSLDDQASTIQLVTTLTDKYGGSINAVANAFTSALESGKVSQATLNQLTSQGIPIQDQLAKKYGVTRDELLKLAKDGKIKVQDLADELVNLGNQTDTVGTKSASAFDKLVNALGETGRAIGSIVTRLAQQLSPLLDAILNQATQVINQINQALAAGSIGEPQKQGFKRQAEQVVAQQAGFLPGGPFGAGQISVSFKGKTFKGQASSVVSQITNQLINEAVASQVKTVVKPPIPRITAPSQAAPSGGRTKKAPKGPEDRTNLLRADLEALIAIGDAEDRIRDLRFTDQAALAVTEQRNKTLADIERDRVKQLEKANFASEKAVINAIAQERALQAQRVAADELRQIEFERVKTSIEAKNALQEAVQPILEVSTQQRNQLEDAKKFNQLVREGILPAEAERLINFERLVQSELQSLDTTIARSQARVTELETEIQALEVKADALALEGQTTDEILAQIQARGGNINKIKEEIDALRARRDAIAGAAGAGPGAAPTNRERLQNEIGQLQGQLNQLVDPINQLVIGAQAIGDAFSQSFRDIISGTVPVQQALSNFFSQVASSFLDNAAQIIAAQLQIYLLQTILGFVGGAASAGAGSGGGLGNLVSGFRQYSLPAFAEGGFVTGPTNAIIGEGGQPEYVIPASKMSAAMNRYAAGSRGASVIPSGDEKGGAPALATAPMEPIDVRYSVERINNVDYVTTDQFQRGLAQAAQQGAIQGERRALRTLSNSPANRRRVGL